MLDSQTMTHSFWAKEIKNKTNNKYNNGYAHAVCDERKGRDYWEESKLKSDGFSSRKKRKKRISLFVTQFRVCANTCAKITLGSSSEVRKWQMEKVKEAKRVVKVGGNTNTDAHELFY